LEHIRDSDFIPDLAAPDARFFINKWKIVRFTICPMDGNLRMFEE
jgi:hypothetical protein